MSFQKQVVEAMFKLEAYKEESGPIEMTQTHISFVFFTKDHVFKVKKAVNLGFLDFTTLKNRFFFCQKELELNRRLCDDLYIEVVPINRSDIIKIKGNGETIEYAVKMKRLPQEKIMKRLLKENKVDKKHIDGIAKILADFHLKAKTSIKISEFGSSSIIETNWNENFLQTREFVGETISARNFNFIQVKVSDFIKNYPLLFAKRVSENRVRDCHGDIHSGNIFIADKIYIFDAIEFNERFRYSDVAADIAFLAMDLDFNERYDLSSFLVDRYIKHSRDSELRKILLFYKCYRAYVRGKVTSFKFNDSNLGVEEKKEALTEARAYFILASKYADSL